MEKQLTILDPPKHSFDHSYPAKSGVCFAQGEVTKATGLRLFDSKNELRPMQSNTLSKWEDGSIKSLLISTNISEKDKTLRLIQSNQKPSKAKNPLIIKKTKTALSINNGLISAKINKHGLSGITSNGKKIMNKPWELKIQGLSFAWYKVEKVKFKLEIQGPMRTVIKLTGSYQLNDNLWINCITRLTFYADFPGIFITHTLVDEDPQSQIRLRNIGIVIPTPSSTSSKGFFGGEKSTSKIIKATPSKKDASFIYQKGRPGSSEMLGWKTSFCGSGTGQYAQGWCGTANKSTNLAIGIRHFGEQFPKELLIENDSIQAWLHTDRGGEYFWSECPGIAKTHDLLLYAGKEKNTQHVFETFEKRPFLSMQCQDYCDTGVFEFVTPENTASKSYDKAWIQAKHKLKFLRDGWKHYGDFIGAGAAGPPNDQPYNNHHYEEARNFLIQFIRSGNKAFLDEGEIGVRHFSDIDIQHSAGPNRYADGQHSNNNPGPGCVWMHYSHDHQGVGHVSHYHLGGMVQYYYLTGDERTYEVINEVADHVCNLLENPPDIMSVEYNMGAASREAAPYDNLVKGDWGQQRDWGWLLYLLIESYNATGKDRYITNGLGIIKRLKKHWQKTHTHYVKGKAKETIKPPHGAWMSYYLDEQKRLCSGMTWTSAIVLMACCRFHHLNKRLNLTPTTWLENMIVQNALYFAKHIWSDSFDGFRYSESNPPRPNKFWPTSIYLFPLKYAANISNNKKLNAITEKAYDGSHGIRCFCPKKSGEPYDATYIPFWQTPHYLAIKNTDSTLNK